jgi:hypothetical protein
MTFSSLSLSQSPATNFTGQVRDSDQRRSVVPDPRLNVLQRDFEFVVLRHL